MGRYSKLSVDNKIIVKTITCLIKTKQVPINLEKQSKVLVYVFQSLFQIQWLIEGSNANTFA